jgi:hypothetical protein
MLSGYVGEAYKDLSSAHQINPQNEMYTYNLYQIEIQWRQVNNNINSNINNV